LWFPHGQVKLQIYLSRSELALLSTFLFLSFLQGEKQRKIVRWQPTQLVTFVQHLRNMEIPYPNPFRPWVGHGYLECQWDRWDGRSQCHGNRPGCENYQSDDIHRRSDYGSADKIRTYLWRELTVGPEFLTEGTQRGLHIIVENQHARLNDSALSLSLPNGNEAHQRLEVFPRRLRAADCWTLFSAGKNKGRVPTLHIV